jgi:hypothetical protein
MLYLDYISTISRLLRKGGFVVELEVVLLFGR